MKTLSLFLIPLLAGCISTNHISSTSGLNQSDLQSIPASAKEIYVTVAGVTPQALHDQVVSILINRGHRIQREDKERFYVTTEGKDVGESTLQRMVITTTEAPNVGAVTKIVSEWRAGTSATMGASAFSGLAVTSEWETAKYGVSRPGIAFAEGVAVGKAIPSGSIQYKF